ncbi:MAG TPA: WecB/TagA/CpsF family glycosyltransferase [Stenomitos sp.]
MTKQLDILFNWAHERQSRAVCLVDLHLLVEAYIQAEFQLALCLADLIVLNDPLISRILKTFKNKNIPLISEIMFFEAICDRAAQERVSIYLLGSQNKVLDILRARLTTKFPSLVIAGSSALPFCSASLDEDEVVTQEINRTGAGIVLVSLGCKSQEFWMSQHKDKVKSVMVGLGAVFPSYIGISNQSPQVRSRLKRYFSAVQILITYILVQTIGFSSLRRKLFKTD